MQLISPNQIHLDETSQALLADVDEVARRVNDARPLPAPVLQRIDEALLGDRVYTSNAIEGNTLDRRETVLVLSKGVGAIQEGRKREAIEAKNLGEAVKQVTELFEQQRKMTIEGLLAIHHTLLRGIDDSTAGRFRVGRVMITGAKHQLPKYEVVGPLVEQMIEILQEGDDVLPVVKAAWAHWSIARIHPFQDGNGRTARLLQDLVLLQNGLTCAVIEPTARTEYIDALGRADEGEFNPLIQLIAQRVLHTFDRYLAALRENAELDEFARRVAGEADERLDQKRQLEYLRWKRRMSQIRTEFERCAAKITDHSEQFNIQVRPYDIIDQTRWENILTGLGAEKTWYFIVDFSRGTRLSRYFFFFGRHFWTALDNEQDRAEQRVSLLVSKDDGTGHGVPLDQWDACPVTIREVFIVNDQFTCRVVNEQGEAEYRRGVEPIDIATHFIERIVLWDLK